LKDNLVLIGMPGSGKSTVGVVLAKMLGMNFVDVDLLIQQREGALLQTILDQRGTDVFLDVEADAVCSLDCDHSVIAPGGSAVLRDRAGEHLKQLGTVVYLKIPVDALADRLTNLAERGVPLEPGQTIADLYDYRQPFYEKYADLTVDTAGLRLEETCSAVLDALERRKNG
jgi:shikimate kinase